MYSLPYLKSRQMAVVIYNLISLTIAVTLNVYYNISKRLTDLFSMHYIYTICPSD